MSLDEVVEVGAADLLFALDQELHVDRQVAVLLQMRLNRLEVHEDLALVVGRAARVDLAVANRRLERRGRPQVKRIDRLHIVVAVEQDGRRARRSEPLAIDDRMPRCFLEARILESDALEFFGGPFGCLADVTFVFRKRADARDREVTASSRRCSDRD
ncbi:MAG: hypothetical protein WKG07_46485 [Hymenobacter sp.]